MKPMRNGAFLQRLARNTSGNTLAIMAAAFFPLAGLIGGGVDMTRIYITKTRLQQACDAGALAGRKVMAAGAWSTDGDTSARGRAYQMFAANFESGDFGTSGLTREYTEDEGTVTGVASADVPMTIMKIFGKDTQDVSVTCTAEMEIPNTDVMFVLDVTGSMAWDDKIDGLQSAVLCFYEALVRVNTDEVCGSDPTATEYNGTAQIRLGFVPYSVNVNVGRLLPNDFLADEWTYQTRQGVFYTVGAPTAGTAYEETAYFNRSWKCEDWASGQGGSGFPSDSSTPDSFTGTTLTYAYVSYNSGTDLCKRSVTPSTATYTRDDANGTYFHTWIYDEATLDVSGLKAGESTWNNSISMRIGNGGTLTDVAWAGCVEERQTFQNTDGDGSDDWDPIPEAALDMDIDLIPDEAVAGTQWGPMLPNAVWGRFTGTDPITTSSNLNRNRSSSCTTEARRLQEYLTSANLTTYVNSFNPAGNTYHDVGMLWGARLLSPTGIFADDNDLTANGGAIERHLIFMSDGDAQTDNENLYSFGLPTHDRRQTSYSPSSAQLTGMVEARFEALCTLVKNMNVTLWVISYGGGLNEDNEARLEACASPGRYYEADDGAALIEQFRQIASEIADLRLTQ